MNNEYIIFFKCLGGSGYFTGIKSTSVDREICTHPYVSKAKRYESKAEAIKTAQHLKRYFNGIIYYDIKEVG